MARKPCTSDCGSFHSYRLPPLFLPSPTFLSRPSLAPPSTPSSRELNEKLAPLLALLSATFLIKRFHPPPPEKYQNSGSPVTSQFRWNNEFPLEIVAANLRKRRSSLYRGYSDRAHRFETFQILRPDTGFSSSSYRRRYTKISLNGVLFLCNLPGKPARRRGTEYLKMFFAEAGN